MLKASTIWVILLFTTHFNLASHKGGQYINDRVDEGLKKEKKKKNLNNCERVMGERGLNDSH